MIFYVYTRPPHFDCFISPDCGVGLEPGREDWFTASSTWQISDNKMKIYDGKTEPYKTKDTSSLIDITRENKKKRAQ
jgi:hypothetical protein